MEKPNNNNNNEIESPLNRKSIKWYSKLELISLNVAFTTVLITILQVYLIGQRFKILANLSSHTINTAIHSSSQFHSTILVDSCVLILASLFSAAYALLNSFKLGIYAHDNFKLGKNIDKATERSRYGDLQSTPGSSSLNSDETASSSITKQNLIKPKLECCLWFRKRGVVKFWSQLPPLGSASHLISALLILVADVLLASKRIQLGQTPAGDIFATRLDFVIGQPIERQPALGEMFSSKDDFSGVIQSDAITLDYFNLLVAVFGFTIKIAQQFWATSHRYTILIFFNGLIVSLLMVVSFCGLEIVVKASQLKRVAKEMLVSNTDWHGWESTAMYLASTLILYTNLWILAKWGYGKYVKQTKRFESNVQAYLVTSSKSATYMVQRQPRFSFVAESSSASITSTTNRTNNSSDSDSFEERTTGTKSKSCGWRHALRSYWMNLLSSALFLVYCLFRSVFVYDTFVVFKCTLDFMLVICLVVEMMTLVAWIVALLLITKKTKWAFGLHVTYRLVYWNRAYAHNRRTKENLFGEYGAIEMERDAETATIAKIKTEENKSSRPISTIMMSSKPVLLVRDDSIMSKSYNMSSSSITEVSSLMPSTIAAAVAVPLAHNNKQHKFIKFQNVRVNNEEEAASWTTKQHRIQQPHFSSSTIGEIMEPVVASSTIASNSSPSSSLMEKASPSGSSSGSGAVDSGRDSIIESPVNSASFKQQNKYLFGNGGIGMNSSVQFKVPMPIQQQQQQPIQQQTVKHGVRNNQKYLDTHC